MEAFSDIGFGIQLNTLATGKDHPLENAFDVAQEVTANREGQLQETLKTIDSTVLRFIFESIASHARGEKRTDGVQNIVSLVLDSSDLEGEADPQVLRSIVIAAIIAGRETSAHTLSWFIYLLSQHPEVECRVRAEIFEKIPRLALETGFFPSMDEAQSLTYLEAAIKETLRLYLPASFNIKHCNADTFLSDGTFVPEGTTIGLPSYTMGRLASTWGADCNEYKPERFLDEDTGKLLSVSPFKFPAFFAGPRICVSMNLAMLEMKIVLAG